MAKNYALDVLSKLHDHFEDSTGFIEGQLAEYDDGEKRSAAEARTIVNSIIDNEIK